jgi:hypothetical protein
MPKDDVVIPLVLRIPRSSFDAWNEIAGHSIPDEEYIDGIIDDDLTDPPDFTVERTDR